MKVEIYRNAAQIGKAAASLCAAKILAKPDCVLGMATGSTPLPTYEALVELYTQGVINFARVRSFNLDEYVGLSRAHEQSYYQFMFTNLFAKININPNNVQIPHPVSANPDDDCATYEAALEAAGGIDLQILGIGHNGHIAFNEPSTIFPAKTHIVELSERTIEANTRFFASADEVPRQAMTMGIGSIMKAREIILIANGMDKAEAVAAMIHGEIDPQCPASVLQLHHATTVFLDDAAASLL
jgi:glucosamine-6-phosphate deaminase